MPRLEITSPDPALCGTVARIVFVDGKASVTALTDGQRALLVRHGFTVTDPETPPPTPQPQPARDPAEPETPPAPARTTGRRKPPPAQPNDE